MQRTSAMFRLSVHALVLAFAALLLVAIGCTGAQASHSQAVTAQPDAPASTSISVLAAPARTGPSPTTGAATPDAGGSTSLDKGSLIQAPLNQAAHEQPVLSQTAAASRPPACIPGRDTDRLEKNAVSAPTALLQHSPAGTSSRNAAQTGWDADASHRPGRIPEALTHLDLGIVRT